MHWQKKKKWRKGGATYMVTNLIQSLNPWTTRQKHSRTITKKMKKVGKVSLGRAEEATEPIGSGGKYSNYTPLTGEQEDILSVVEDKGLAKYP